MAAPIVNFTSEYSITNDHQLVLTDTSTYNDTIILNRQWVISKPDGTVDTIDAPISGSNSVLYTIDKDYALVIRLRLNYNPSIADSGFAKTRNILAANELSSAIYDLRKTFMVISVGKTKTRQELIEFLVDLEMADSYYESAVNLISSDIIETQDALELGIEQARLCNCN